MIDVLVVGAGPAGAVAAQVLAERGARVLVVDRARFPRHKLCGDALNPGAVALLRRIGVADAIERDALRIEGMRLTGRGVSICARYPASCYGLSITRRDLDTRLVEAAARAGARIQEGVVVRGPLVETREGRPTVRGVVLAIAGGKPLRVAAPLTIAADGRRSALAVSLGLTHHPKRPRRWAIGGYFEGVDGLEALGEMHVRRDHYLGVAPVPGGLANACVVTADRRGFADPARRLVETVQRDALLGPRFARARLVTAPTTLGPLAVDGGAAGTKGLLLAGDAAGFVDPMTGDGLRLAFASALLAAETALEALDGQRDAAHERLTVRRQAMLANKLRFNRAVRALVASPWGVRMGEYSAVLAPRLFEHLILFAGDVP
ncbi:MAG: NAD(P)-binding protein [Luteitalea sp.]|nr:NAD(P)-binding protein [Luteitalea sp.]